MSQLNAKMTISGLGNFAAIDIVQMTALTNFVSEILSCRDMHGFN